jgi:exonuclease SbcC
MRPLRLKVKGFTAFRDEVEIDFTDHYVFAISGATGAGKSSLLDAMTYVLYGRVERVGDRVGQLISQGQPRMSVTLEFQVGLDRYRLTRTTPARGATKIMLERADTDDDWQQAGDGADRVRDVEQRVVATIGLTYDGFTRSVLLPQGKFAEFLVGDAKKRRDILTELLGLSMFGRMAKRAGVLGNEAAIRSQERNRTLDVEYAGVTNEALAAARLRAEEAAARERAMAAAAEAMVAILERRNAAQREEADVRASAAEVVGAVELVRLAVAELGGIDERIAVADGAVEQAATRVQATKEALSDAEAALGAQRDAGASAVQLAEAQATAHDLAEAIRSREAAESERAAAAAHGAELRAAEESAAAQAAAAREALVEAEGRLAAADRGRTEAQHADMAAALSAGLSIGDPCPVCGVPLETAPASAAGGPLEEAERARAAAGHDVDRARSAASAAERDLHVAHTAVEAADRDVRRAAAAAADHEERTRTAAETLRPMLGPDLPQDPEAAIRSMLRDLEDLERAQREAAAAARDAVEAMSQAERRRDDLAALVERCAERLTADQAPMLERSMRSLHDAGGAAAPAVLPEPPSADVRRDPTALAAFGIALRDALDGVASRLAAELDARSSGERTLLVEATQVVGDLVPRADSLEALAAAVSDACRRATADAATTHQQAGQMAEALDRRRALAKEVKQLDHRAQVFKQLAQELRADRLIAFLQAEALQVLAAAGSDRLLGLSGGRYRLVCKQDEFSVVDTWNGDEERSVRTLSGGETFLASLALALALADQVRSLSVVEQARLDSLFLDEGFGTLDAETLQVVVDAIERLAGDGRLVGVVTHVRELAEQFPRLEVEKSPSGSSVRLVAI